MKLSASQIASSFFVVVLFVLKTLGFVDIFVSPGVTNNGLARKFSGKIYGREGKKKDHMTGIV